MLRRRIFGILGIEFLEFSDSLSEHRLDDLILNAWLDLYAGIYIYMINPNPYLHTKYLQSIISAFRRSASRSSGDTCRSSSE